MFVFAEWVVAGIIDGYKKGLTPFSKVTEREMTAEEVADIFVDEEEGGA